MISKTSALLLSFIALCYGSFAQEKYPTAFENSGGLETATYEEVIDFYNNLAEDYESIKVLTKGPTDSGEPLHLVIYDPNGDFEPVQWKKEQRLVVLVNNGIHPGEPAGIDASMMYLRDVASGKLELPASVVLAFVPVYNIGGHLNRNNTTRVNQVGPEKYGFRGNARNYDLNRDFIKTDSQNSASFQEIFQSLMPHVFIDTHTSNGADYQHVMTLIETQHNMLGGQAGKLMHDRLSPLLFEKMDAVGYPMVPYVNVWGGVPEDGWKQFKDSPRYSSGYASLFHTISYVPEAHMLKSYQQRVEATYSLLEAFGAAYTVLGDELVNAVEQDRAQAGAQQEFGLNYSIDENISVKIPFKGYKSGYKPSEISGLDRLYYDRNEPFETEVDFYDSYFPELKIQKPAYYIIGQAWKEVIANLQRNQVKMKVLENDTLIKVNAYYIEDFETRDMPYEGHYLHSSIQVRSASQVMAFRKGDLLIPTDQQAIGYIIEVLEPQGEDSFFAWNYFDAILQSKEGFSPYVFEDLAANYLAQNPGLKEVLEQKKASDPDFAADGYAQLSWVYQHSPWREREYRRYPVVRID
ncbi:hypothetical protein GCM10007049_09100 [Echinicola pacifica]|uniref:Zinc carboxypeptidase n=1 Tax=Echinicola pacifica TaxID=346377 RepID=A0A918PR53_9BACT|nr:hypothetical protein [Echinicola pacifica]GGZ18970.1 hypothetical protein GCM10007049_09100 [Echinicola pacifica]